MTGQRILVVGGTGGIGSAVVRRLHDLGYVVDITWHTRDPSSLSTHHSAYQCDLSDIASRQALITRLSDEGIDYYGLVHAAGATADALVFQLSDVRSRSVFEINFWSLVDLSRALAMDMLRNRSGRIVAIGSVASRRASRGNSIYSASKAAVGAFVRGLSIECAGRNVCVNEVQPGFIDTEMLAASGLRPDQVAPNIPAKRLGKGTDVAAAVAFLMSEDAAYVNGTSLCVDGGLTLS